MSYENVRTVDQLQAERRELLERLERIATPIVPESDLIQLEQLQRLCRLLAWNRSELTMARRRLRAASSAQPA